MPARSEVIWCFGAEPRFGRWKSRRLGKRGPTTSQMHGSSRRNFCGGTVALFTTAAACAGAPCDRMHCSPKRQSALLAMSRAIPSKTESQVGRGRRKLRQRFFVPDAGICASRATMRPSASSSSTARLPPASRLHQMAARVPLGWCRWLVPLRTTKSFDVVEVWAAPCSSRKPASAEPRKPRVETWRAPICRFVLCRVG